MKPILFNTEMVRAILEDRKTVTRRVVKLKYSNTHLEMFTNKYGTRMIEKQNDVPGVTMVRNPDGTTTHTLLACIEKDPPYRPGDILYVRETFFKDVGRYMYKADYSNDEKFYRNGREVSIKWRPSIHMPREAARIFLRVTNVRVDRLQDITVKGVLREGVPDIEPPPICRKEPFYTESFPKGFDKWNTEKRDDWIKSEARARYIGWCEYADKLFGYFKTVWDSTIKPACLSLYGWEANPWVWVVEFERCEKPNGGQT